MITIGLKIIFIRVMDLIDYHSNGVIVGKEQCYPDQVGRTALSSVHTTRKYGPYIRPVQKSIVRNAFRLYIRAVYRSKLYSP